MPSRLAPLDFQTPAIDLAIGTFTARWRELLRLVIGDVASISSLPAVINRWALADQPSLGAADAGYLAFVSDYGHLVRWTGTVWEFAPGDCGNGFLRDFVQAPQEVGWALCDGGATTFLVVGAATLTTAAFTTPNLTGTAAYKKSAAVYAGISAAGGASASDGAHTHAVSGSAANATATISGATAAESAHTHTGETSSQNGQGPSDLQSGTGYQPAHYHGFTTSAGSAHQHAVGTLAVDNHQHGAGTLAADSNGAHTHGIGSLDPAHVDVLPYFRR